MKSIKGPKAPKNPLLSDTSENGPFRLLGDIKITGNKLSLNATGEQRFALGKQRLESLLGSTAKHRIDSMQSMESALAERGQSKGMGDYNNQPQEELGGLSPIQVRTLMGCDWEEPEGPIQLSRSLTFEDLKEVPLFHNARLLIHHASQEGGIRATGAGFLNTTFVRLMLVEGKWPQRWKAEFERRAKGRLREMDIRHLHSLRLICGWAGFIKKRRDSFQITLNGRKYLDDENAHRLYRWLFLMQFQKLNLDLYDRHGLESREIQNGIEFSLCQIGRLPKSAWHNLAEVGPRLMLPFVKREITSREDHQVWNEFQINAVTQDLGYRLIEPLEIFGLVETQDKEKPLFRLSTSTEFRRTGLWDRFISFNL